MCSFHGCAGILHIPGQMGPGELLGCSSCLKEAWKGLLPAPAVTCCALLSAVTRPAPGLFPASPKAPQCLAPGRAAAMCLFPVSL